MNNKLMVIRGRVRLVGDRFERRIARFQKVLSRRMQESRQDLVGTLKMYQALVKANQPAWLTSFQLWNDSRVGQAGNSTIGLLLAAAGIIIGLAFFVTKGLPILYTQTSNTTAMASSGMTAEQIQYWMWGLWLLILVVVGGTAMLIMRKYGHLGGGGGGGGGGGRRRRK